jgi:uncharacterized membrane protein YgaE (UPF0421/DUF939 family)
MIEEEELAGLDDIPDVQEKQENRKYPKSRRRNRKKNLLIKNVINRLKRTENSITINRNKLRINRKVQ